VKKIGESEAFVNLLVALFLYVLRGKFRGHFLNRKLM
jgi:hypothetical protein